MKGGGLGIWGFQALGGCGGKAMQSKFQLFLPSFLSMHSNGLRSSWVVRPTARSCKKGISQSEFGSIEVRGRWREHASMGW
jgi:hypothetical protein